MLKTQTKKLQTQTVEEGNSNFRITGFKLDKFYKTVSASHQLQADPVFLKRFQEEFALSDEQLQNWCKNFEEKINPDQAIVWSNLKALNQATEGQSLTNVFSAFLFPNQNSSDSRLFGEDSTKLKNRLTELAEQERIQEDVISQRNFAQVWEDGPFQGFRELLSQQNKLASWGKESSPAVQLELDLVAQLMDIMSAQDKITHSGGMSRLQNYLDFRIEQIQNSPVAQSAEIIPTRLLQSTASQMVSAANLGYTIRMALLSYTEIISPSKQPLQAEEVVKQEESVSKPIKQSPAPREISTERLKKEPINKEAPKTSSNKNLFNVQIIRHSDYTRIWFGLGPKRLKNPTIVFRANTPIHDLPISFRWGKIDTKLEFGRDGYHLTFEKVTLKPPKSDYSSGQTLKIWLQEQSTDELSPAQKTIINTVAEKL